MQKKRLGVMRNDYVRRIENITLKAKENDVVKKLFIQCFQEINNYCKDKDLMSLTYLWMTANYVEEKDFTEEYRREYDSLKGEFAREESVIKKLRVENDVYQFREEEDTEE